MLSEMTTGGVLIGAARDNPDGTALVFPDRRQTYTQLGRAADDWTRRLVALGVRPGEHVGLLMANGPAFVELLFAIGQAGAVAVPVNPRYRADELRLRRALSEYDRTSHHVSNPLIEVDDSEVRLTASVYAYHVRKASGAPWHFWGRYEQGVVAHNGGWAIAHMRLVGIDADPAAENLRGPFSGHPDRRPVVAETLDPPITSR